MRPFRSAAFLAGLATVALMCPACHRTRPRNVARVEVVSGDDWEGAGRLGVSPQDALRLLKDLLAQDRRFHLPGPGESLEDEDSAIRLSLGVGLGASGEPEGRNASVELRLVARCRGPDGEPVRLDALAGLMLPDSPVPDRSAQTRSLLARALLEAKEETAAQLQALQAPDAVLVKQLTSQDGNAREAALHILTLRKHRAAVPVWIGRLQGPDPLAVRQAIGALIEIKDPAAAPALIDLAHRKDTGFVREIIFALEAIGGDEAKGYLYTVAQGHEDALVREAAQAAWKSLEARQPREPE